MKRTDKFTAFTLIELMVGIVLTVLTVTIFFRFFNHVTTAEQGNNYKTSALVQGASSLEAFANAAKLIGLTTTYPEFVSTSTVPRLIQQSLGTNTGNQAVEFIFNSVFGGPITKIKTGVTGGMSGGCTLPIERTAANTDGSLGKYRIITTTDVYYVSITDITNDEIKTTGGTTYTSEGVNIATGNCHDRFPMGSVITGPNYFYRLSWNLSAGVPFVLERAIQPYGFDFAALPAFANSETLISIPRIQVPLVILQFLRLPDPTATPPIEIWEDGRAYTATGTPNYRDIKAVRIAVVLLPQTAKDMKGASTSGISQEICPFDDDGCVTIDDISRPPIVFKKVIYLRNIDYLRRVPTS